MADKPDKNIVDAVWDFVDEVRDTVLGTSAVIVILLAALSAAFIGVNVVSGGAAGDLLTGVVGDLPVSGLTEVDTLFEGVFAVVLLFISTGLVLVGLNLFRSKNLPLTR